MAALLRAGLGEAPHPLAEDVDLGLFSGLQAILWGGGRLVEGKIVEPLLDDIFTKTH